MVSVAAGKRPPTLKQPDSGCLRCSREVSNKRSDSSLVPCPSQPPRQRQFDLVRAPWQLAYSQMGCRVFHHGACGWFTLMPAPLELSSCTGGVRCIWSPAELLAGQWVLGIRY